MIVQNNGNRKYLIDGLVIQPHKTYQITPEQYNRIKGFGDIKPLCVINQQNIDKDKNKDKSNKAKSANKNLTDKDKNKDKQSTDKTDNEQQSDNNK